MSPGKRQVHPAPTVNVYVDGFNLYYGIRIVMDEFGLTVGLLNPHRRASQALVALRPAFIKQIRRGPLSVSQFPAQITDSRGHKISKPIEW